MALYRILQNVSKGGKRGEIVSGSTWPPEHLTRLEAVGAIIPISTPPLSELPGWEERAILLEEEDVFMLDEFVEADPERLANRLSITTGEVARLKIELLTHLKA